MWYRLAHHQHRSLSEVMDNTGAIEFIQWNVILRHMDEEAWKAREKIEFYLAQLTAEVYNLPLRMFVKNPDLKKIKDFLLDPVITNSPISNPAPRPDRQSSYLSEEETDKNGEEKEKNKGYIETGKHALTDPKWSVVNANAKSMWYQRLGIDPRNVKKKEKEKNG